MTQKGRKNQGASNEESVKPKSKTETRKEKKAAKKQKEMARLEALQRILTPPPEESCPLKCGEAVSHQRVLGLHLFRCSLRDMDIDGKGVQKFGTPAFFEFVFSNRSQIRNWELVSKVRGLPNAERRGRTSWCQDSTNPEERFCSAYIKKTWYTTNGTDVFVLGFTGHVGHGVTGFYTLSKDCWNPLIADALDVNKSVYHNRLLLLNTFPETRLYRAPHDRIVALLNAKRRANGRSFGFERAIRLWRRFDQVVATWQNSGFAVNAPCVFSVRHGGGLFEFHEMENERDLQKKRREEHRPAFEGPQPELQTVEVEGMRFPLIRLWMDAECPHTNNECDFEAIWKRMILEEPALLELGRRQHDNDVMNERGDVSGNVELTENSVQDVK